MAGKRNADESWWLRKIKKKLRRYRTVVYDLESKNGDTSRKGFTRPFLAWKYDGEEHQCFRQPKHLKDVPWKEAPWLDDGGVIDLLMRDLLGLNLCGPCDIANQRALEDPDIRLRLCDTCRELRGRYQSKKARIYAHNAGRFDALFIVPWLERHDARFEFEISGPESRIQQLTVWPRGRNRKQISWTFLDSVAILPMSLKKIGETFCGVKERKISLDLDIDEDDLAWEAYNRRDCEVLHSGVENLNAKVISLGGEVGVTAPSTAMSVFRHVHLEKPIARNKHLSNCLGYRVNPVTGSPLIEDDEDADSPWLECTGCAHDFARLGYYGGRTELFHAFGRDVRYFDINSSYPRSMLEPMPVGRMREFGPEQDLDFYRKLRKKKHVGFMEVTVWIPDDCVIPPLPSRSDGKLKFQTGTLRGVWDWDELQLLFHPRVNGKIVEVHRSVWYEARPVFKSFVETFYALRQVAKKSGDAAMSELCKLLMNALYGKFGMRIERSTLVWHRLGDPPPAKNARPLTGDPDGEGVWEVPRLVEAPYVIPQIAAKVTSESRIRLFLGMMSVLDQGGKVLYCDTDSIMCENAKVLPEGDLLGEWKREYPDVLMDGTFVLPKLYQLRMHEPKCDDRDCPGCRWHLVIEDLEEEKKFEDFVDHLTVDDIEAFRSEENLRFSLKPPSVEKLKGVPHRMHTPSNFRKILPANPVYKGKGERVYIDGDMITQHRVMMRERLPGPRVYEGIPGDATRAALLPSIKSAPLEYQEKIEKALASGDVVHVAKVVELLRKKGYAALAEEVKESEKYRARFKSVRSSYDKRDMMLDGSTRPIHVDLIDGKMVEVRRPEV